MTTQASAQTIQQTNLANRMRLLQYGIRNTVQLPSITSTFANTISFPCQQTGLTTGLRCFVSLPLTITAAMTASEFCPTNLIQKVQIVDQSNLERTNCSGWQLWQHQNFKHRDNDGLSRAYSGHAGDYGSINTNLFNIPTATGSDSLLFSLYIPLAYDPMSDLTGSILTQTQTGQVQVYITFASGLVGSDTYMYPYSAGTATGSTITVTPYQEYIGVGNGIQLSNVAELPLLDLNTAYGFSALTTDNANVISNATKQIWFPTNRTVYSQLTFFENGNSGTLNETDITNYQLLYNSNQPIINCQPQYLRYKGRQLLGSDAPSGVYYIGRRMQPVNTNYTGQVCSQFQLGTVATGGGTVGFITSHEVTYPLGSALPGQIV